MTPKFNSLTTAPARTVRTGPDPGGAWPACASNASAYVTPAQAEHAVERGAGWFETGQQESGDLGSDWAMTALAAAGINAADVRTSLADPSAQDFYLDEWQASGPGGAGTDAERGILAGVAGGIQTSRLSTAADTTTSNLVARVAELFDGTQIGEPGLLNDDIFGVLALHQAGAPPELLRADRRLPADQAAARRRLELERLARRAGRHRHDRLRRRRLLRGGRGYRRPRPGAGADLLHSLQDPATGGFIAPPESFGVGVNTDTTSWVASGLIQCGIDPQGPEWTTAQGKTPLDYLVSMQRPDGHFDWTEEYGGGAFETYRLGAAAGRGRLLDRATGAARRRQPGGAAGRRRGGRDAGPDHARDRPRPGCRRRAHVPGRRRRRLRPRRGSGRRQGRLDAGCLRQRVRDQLGTGRHRRLLARRRRRNARYGWSVRVDGAAAQAETHEPIGFGDLVFLKFGATVADPGPAPRSTVPPVEPVKRKASAGPRHLPPRQGPLAATAHRGRGALPARARRRRLPRPADRAVPQAPRRAPARRRLHRLRGRLGDRASTLTVPATAALRKRLAQRRWLKLRLTAATRGEDGARPPHPREAVHRRVSRRLLAIATTVALAAVVAVASARGATVDLRVDSSTDPVPLFDGSVTTLPHPVDGGDGSGPHPCSGPPGATPGGDRHRGARRRDARRRHRLARQLGPELPRLLHRPHRPLRLGGSRPLLVADGQRPLRQRRLPGPGRRRRLGPLLLRPALRRPSRQRSRAAAGGPAGPRAEDPARPGERRPAGREAAAGRGAGGDLPAALARSGGSGLGTAGAGAAAGRRPRRRPPAPCSAAARRSCRDGSLGEDVNATALAALALEERRPRSAAGRPLARLGPGSRAAASASGRESRPTSTPPASPSGPWPARGCGRRRGAAAPSCARRRRPTAASRPFPAGTPTRRAPASPWSPCESPASAPGSSPRPGRTPLDFLASLARRNGSIAYAGQRRPDPGLDDRPGPARAHRQGEAARRSANDRAGRRRLNTLPGPQRSSMEARLD